MPSLLMSFNLSETRVDDSALIKMPPHLLVGSTSPSTTVGWSVSWEPAGFVSLNVAEDLQL